MAGSDLDGDLYFVTWHENLMLKKNNEPPMHFPASEEQHLNRPVTEADIINQLKYNVESDLKGRVSRQHLIFADLYGIDSDQCLMLADLSAKLYDAPKTGVVPEWPSELKTKMAPDFLEKGDHKETYESKRVLGKLYRHSKLMLETVSGSSNYSSARHDDDDVAGSTSSATEMAHLLQESYGTVVQDLCTNYNIKDEVSFWRARLPNFRHTEEEKGSHMRLLDNFRQLHQTIQTQHKSALRQLTRTGMTDSDSRHQVLLKCKHFGRTKPFHAGLAMMLYDDEIADSGHVYEETGQTIIYSITSFSDCRLLTADCIGLFDRGKIYVFLKYTWLLALTSFLVEHLCRQEDEMSSLLSKLDCIVRVLFHVIIKQQLCFTDDIVRCKDSVGFIMKFFVKYRIASRLSKQLHEFRSSADKSDFGNVGKAAVHALWDIYTKQEASKINGYEDWELKLKDDALVLLLRFAFRNGFGTPTKSCITATG